MNKFKWLKEWIQYGQFATEPKVAFINNKVITKETNVISLSQWYPKYM